MRAGRLRHRVCIEKKQSTATNMGSESIEWVEHAIVWGGIEPLSGREYESSDQIQAETKVRIVVRYVSGVNSEMRVSHNGLVYDIHSVINHDLRNKQLTLMCAEGVNRDAR